jgi:hypothetical protein
MNEEVSEAIRRLRRAPDVQHLAVMPDMHLAEDACVGVAVATSKLLYPQAERQMGGVWFDFRQSDRLRDEAPGAG